MFWWIIALVFLIGWIAGLNLTSLIVLAILFVVAMLASIAEMDRRRHKHNYHQPYRHSPTPDST